MQLDQLVDPIEGMSDDDLRERLKALRNRRTTVRPAAKKRQERDAKKGTVTKINKIAGLFEGLSEEDREAIIKSLGG
jgi:hypothetical protein